MSQLLPQGGIHLRYGPDKRKNWYDLRVTISISNRDILHVCTLLTCPKETHASSPLCGLLYIRSSSTFAIHSDISTVRTAVEPGMLSISTLGARRSTPDETANTQATGRAPKPAIATAWTVAVAGKGWKNERTR
jgi:hypothetical protein